MNEQKLFRCGKSTVVIKEGNILRSKADVIVSSDNVGLQMGTGVAKAIHDAAGPCIDVDLDKVKDVELGDVIVTSAGNLPNRYVFHCISDKRSSSRSLDTIPIIVNRSILKCLNLLPMLGVYSIAIPALGTGAIGLPVDVVAESMLKVIEDHLMQTNHTLSIEIYAWGMENFNIWMNKVKQIECFEEVESNLDNIDKEECKDLDVFISYSWKDQDVALSLDSWLTELGINHFLDRNNLIGGQDHKELIIDSLRHVKLVLFLSSVHSNESPAVKGEICNAINMRIPIIPLRIDMTPYRDSFLYDLVNSLWVDISQGLDQKKDELLRHIKSYKISMHP